MSVLPAIDSLGTGTYSVLRRGAGSYGNDGRWVPAAPTLLSIAAAVQPQAARRLQARAEGRHAEEVRELWTTTALRTTSPGVGSADVVLIDGERWEVLAVERWEAFGETYYSALAARLLEGTELEGAAELGFGALSVSSAGTVA